jgi:hypothetical protein
MSKHRVRVVTGGHHFEAEPFFAMFEANANITWATASSGNIDNLT